MRYLFLIFGVLIYSLFAQPLQAQKKSRKEATELVYFFKKDWSIAPNYTSAAYFRQITKENDSLYICRYYNKEGPMIRQESFQNEQLSVPNGLFCWYNSDGYLDSIGWVQNCYKDSLWAYYRYDKEYLRIEYKEGKMIEKYDFDRDIYMDSSATQFSLKDKLMKDSLRRDSLMLARDSTKPVQQEAKFKSDWFKYIEKNLRIPERLQNVLGQGIYNVIVRFAIDKEGKVGEVFLVKSCEWSADAEVFRVFENAPDWIPALQNSKPVKYVQKQGLTFVVGSY